MGVVLHRKAGLHLKKWCSSCPGRLYTTRSTHLPAPISTLTPTRVAAEGCRRQGSGGYSIPCNRTS
jgi:hypothetical protein